MNAAAHQLTAGAAVGLFLAHGEQKNGQTTVAPLLGGLAASILTKLPDLLEPATSPNHRQFFHSIVFASLLGAGYFKLDQWEPQDSFEELLKTLGKLAIASYLIHLALDSTTRKSLPFLGKL
jgi:inner membrane protein